MGAPQRRQLRGHVEQLAVDLEWRIRTAQSMLMRGRLLKLSLPAASRSMMRRTAETSLGQSTRTSGFWVSVR